MKTRSGLKQVMRIFLLVSYVRKPRIKAVYNILVISGLGAANLLGKVPCKGYRSSQLIGWDSGLGTNPQSHLCNGILDCIDRSDESGCQGSSEVNEGIKMKVQHGTLLILKDQ